MQTNSIANLYRIIGNLSTVIEHQQVNNVGLYKLLEIAYCDEQILQSLQTSRNYSISSAFNVENWQLLAIFGSGNSRDYTIIIQGFRDCKTVRDRGIRHLRIPDWQHYFSFFSVGVAWAGCWVIDWLFESVCFLFVRSITQQKDSYRQQNVRQRQIN